MGAEGEGGREEGGGGGARCRGGAGGLGGLPLYTSDPSHPVLRGSGRRGVGGESRLPLHSFICCFPWCAPAFSWAGPGGGQRGACNEPPRADCGREMDCTYRRLGLPRAMNKQKKTVVVYRVISLHSSRELSLQKIPRAQCIEHHAMAIPPDERWRARGGKPTTRLVVAGQCNI